MIRFPLARLMTKFSLDDLAALVDSRAGTPPETSYTAKLLSEGPAKAAKKLGEEAVEAVIAAVQGDPKALVSEAADVLYHLVVTLMAAGVPLAIHSDAPITPLGPLFTAWCAVNRLTSTGQKLGDDPTAVPPESLKDVPVYGTVIGGRPLALPKFESSKVA